MTEEKPAMEMPTLKNYIYLKERERKEEGQLLKDSSLFSPFGFLDQVSIKDL